MLGLYRDKYSDFTAKHFHEKLVRRHDYVLGHEWSAEVLEHGPDATPGTPEPGALVVSVPYLFRGETLVPLGDGGSAKS